MTHFFLKLLDLSWQASWLILIILAIRLIFKRLPKRHGVWLWALPLLRLLVPFSFPTPYSPVVPIRQLVASDTSPVPVVPTNVIADEVIEVIAPSTAVATLQSLSPMQLGLIVWLAGMVILAGLALIQYISLHRSLRFSLQLSDNVFVSEKVQSAFVMGLFRPKIILPTGLSESDRDIILAHENNHILRRDHLTKLVAFLALCLHWFNPLVWLAYFTSARDIEMACDEGLIEKSDTIYRQSYSQTLLNMTITPKFQPVTPLSFGAGNTAPRIKHILGFKAPNKNVLLAFGLIVLVLAGIFVTSYTPAQTDPLLESLNGHLYQGMSLLPEEEVPAVIRFDKNVFSLTVDPNATINSDDDTIIAPIYKPIKRLKSIQYIGADKQPHTMLLNPDHDKGYTVLHNDRRDSKYRLYFIGDQVIFGRIDNQIDNRFVYLWTLEATNQLPDFIRRTEVVYEYEPTPIYPEMSLFNEFEMLPMDAATQNGRILTGYYSKIFRRVRYKSSPTAINYTGSINWYNPDLAETDRMNIAFRGIHYYNEGNQMVYQGELTFHQVEASAPEKQAYRITLDSNDLILFMYNDRLCIGTNHTLELIAQAEAKAKLDNYLPRGEVRVNRLNNLKDDVIEYQVWYHEPFINETDSPRFFEMRIKISQTP